MMMNHYNKYRSRRSVFSGLSRYRPCTLNSKKCTKNTQRFVKSPRWAGLINQVMHRLQYTKRMVCYIKDYFLFKISLTFSFYWELLVLLSIHNIQSIKAKFSFLTQWFSTGLDLTYMVTQHHAKIGLSTSLSK